MKLLKHAVLALLVAASLTGATVVGSSEPATVAPTQATIAAPPAYNGSLAIDPFVNASDISTAALEPAAFCICLIGTNCCGDGGCPGDSCGRSCQCTCNATGKCVA